MLNDTFSVIFKHRANGTKIKLLPSVQYVKRSCRRIELSFIKLPLHPLAHISAVASEATLQNHHRTYQEWTTNKIIVKQEDCVKIQKFVKNLQGT